MDIKVGNEIFLPIDIHCQEINQYHSNINCQHWSIDRESCQTKCSLNLYENPSKENCMKCKERNSWNGKKVIRIDDETKRLTILDIDKAKETSKDSKMFVREIDRSKFQKEVTKTFTEKAKTYVKAEASQAVQGKVSKKIFEKRKEICMTCEFRVNDKKGQHDEIGWCKGGCGCSIGNPRAALSQKLYMPTLSCPKGKFGVEKGEGFNIEDAKDSAKGLFNSLKSLFKKDPEDK